MRIRDEVIDGNVDSLDENPTVPKAFRVAPYWGPITKHRVIVSFMNIMAWLLCLITTSRPFGGRIYSNGLIVICWVSNDAHEHFQRDATAASSRKNPPKLYPTEPG